MPNPDKLIIRYHPARKAISFKVLDAGKEINTSYETLEKYSKFQKGTFVLNLCGNNFFDDILKPFSGKDTVDISLQTAELDYEDFKLRVDEYNKKNSDRQSKINLLKQEESDTLTDMKTSFRVIKEKGKKISQLLDDYYIKIRNIPCEKTSSSDYINKVMQEIRNEYQKIERNFNALSEGDNVNLCLTGVYSSGKSTLINTLLGYKILPVNIHAETAKMFKIQGVENLESSSITFSTGENENKKTCCLHWDSENHCLMINESNLEPNFHSELEKEIEHSSAKAKLHEQFYSMLTFLNTQANINPCIDIGFPIPLDSQDLRFTIYDTPGSDSNISVHKKILSEALENQTNSILLFILKPDNLSGSGNKELLKQLFERYNNANSIIDIEQSFFIFNYADTHRYILAQVKNEKLKKWEGDKTPIDLADRKVFFISAQYAYAAKSTENNIAEDEEIDTFNTCCPGSMSERFGRYYQHNHYGKSEYATKRMIDKANKKLQESDDACSKYYICSGLYSLEEAIKNYGVRYASSIKTAAIIQSIEAAKDSVSRLVENTKMGTDTKVEKGQEALNKEIKTVNNFITATSDSYLGKLNNFAELKELTRQLEIDSHALQNNLLVPIEKTFDERLNKYFFFDVKIDEQIQEDIQTEVLHTYEVYKKNYEEKRTVVLTQWQSAFIKDFLEMVNKDTSLDDDIKKTVQEFKTPNIPQFEMDKKINELFAGAKLFEYKPLKKIIKTFVNSITYISDKVDESVNKDKEHIPADVHKEDSVSNTYSTIADLVKSGKEKLQPRVNQFKDSMNEWYEKKIKDLHTRTVNKQQVINAIKDWFYEHQDELIGKFTEEFTEAVKIMCSDLSTEFNTNLEKYSVKIKALKEDNKPLEILANYITELQDKFELIKIELDSEI